MLILVTGLPGSGKSSVAQLLARGLNAVVLNSDIIRRELFPELRNYTPQETQEVIRETRTRTEELLRKGYIVILDALFTKQRPRNEYQKFAQKIGVPCKIVHVMAPELDTETRMKLRQQKGNASEATFEYYLDRKPHFEPVSGEHFIINNTGDFQELESQVTQLAKKIAR